MALRALLIDDIEADLEPLARALGDSGWETRVARSAEEIEAARKSEGPFAAVVVEPTLGRRQGFAVLERLPREEPAPCLVLYSELDPAELEPLARQTGAHAFVPKAAGPRRVQASLAHLAPRPPAPRHRILIVDDSELTVRLMQAELEGKGFEILVADSVDRATRLLLKKATRPELVLLDVNMPKVDGAQFCRFIKGSALFKGIKVVLCSSLDPQSLRAVAESCGADGFVTKDSFLSRWVLDEIEKR